MSSVTLADHGLPENHHSEPYGLGEVIPFAPEPPEAMSPAMLRLLDRIAPRLSTRDAGERANVVAGVRADRLADPAVRAHLALHLGLAGRVRRLPEGCGEAVILWDVGGFTPDEIATAAAAAEPFSALARLAANGEDRLYRLACRAHGLPFVALPAGARPVVADMDPLLTGRLEAASFRARHGPVRVFAPPIDRLADALGRLAASGGIAGMRFAVTTPRRLSRALRTAVAERTLSATTGWLAGAEPTLSASACPSLHQRANIVLLLILLPVAFAGVLEAMTFALFCLSALTFLGLGTIRVHAARAVGRGPPAPPLPLPDEDLPSYTVLVPLYREAQMVPGLVAGLAALDYPPDRLEVKLLVEADDRRTLLAAEAACEGRSGFETVVVPPGLPRTKPRALAYGLAFARGDLVTVFDAEDRPDPDQFRKAAAALVRGPDHLACVQARLEIDRDVVGLQRQFAIEYACLFDGLLPWLAAGHMPLPLGGTSNHFKRKALEVTGAWDPYNVTEDADLGIRLRRFGFSCGVIDSVTREEAPAGIRVWLRQRTRWKKGWLMTWLVHMREPRTLWREIGGRDVFVLQGLLAATVLSALLHPIGVGLLGAYSTGLLVPPLGASFLDDIVIVAAAFGILAGYAGNMWLARRTLALRGRKRLMTAVWFMPLYWLLGSVAAWRAVLDLLVRPHYWAKTPHRAHDAPPVLQLGTRIRKRLWRSWSG